MIKNFYITRTVDYGYIAHSAKHYNRSKFHIVLSGEHHEKLTGLKLQFGETVKVKLDVEWRPY
jgi:hypothetical protein